MPRNFNVILSFTDFYWNKDLNNNNKSKQNKNNKNNIFFVGPSEGFSKKVLDKKCSSLAKIYESIHLHEFMIALFSQNVGNIESKSFGRNVDLVVIIESDGCYTHTMAEALPPGAAHFLRIREPLSKAVNKLFRFSDEKTFAHSPFDLAIYATQFHCFSPNSLERIHFYGCHLGKKSICKKFQSVSMGTHDFD